MHALARWFACEIKHKLLHRRYFYGFGYTKPVPLHRESHTTCVLDNIGLTNHQLQSGLQICYFAHETPSKTFGWPIKCFDMQQLKLQKACQSLGFADKVTRDDSVIMSKVHVLVKRQYKRYRDLLNSFTLPCAFTSCPYTFWQCCCWYHISVLLCFAINGTSH